MLIWDVGSESVKALRGFARFMLVAGWPLVAAAMWAARRGAARLGWEGLWASPLVAALLAAALMFLCSLRSGVGQAAFLAAMVFVPLLAAGLGVAALCAKVMPGAGLLVQSGAVTLLCASVGFVLLNYILP